MSHATSAEQAATSVSLRRPAFEPRSPRNVRANGAAANASPVRSRGGLERRAYFAFPTRKRRRGAADDFNRETLR